MQTYNTKVVGPGRRPNHFPGQPQKSPTGVTTHQDLDGGPAEDGDSSSGSVQVAGAWEQSVEAGRRRWNALAVQVAWTETWAYKAAVGADVSKRLAERWNALGVQVAWTETWAYKAAVGADVSKRLADWSRQIVEVMQRWTETQKTLWERWFETIKQADPAIMANSLADLRHSR